MGAGSDVVGHRVRVVGTAGSGKTTFARELAARLGVPHLELDRLHHRAGWVPAPVEEFRGELAAFVADAPDGWVIDGDYQDRAAGLTDQADTVVWLDFPRPVVMRRVVRRTVVRSLTRRELWNGNRERPAGMLSRDPEDNIVLWAWRTHGPNRVRFAAAAGPHWVRLRSPGEARRWLSGVGIP